jgi:hypothetical protein
MPSRWCVCVHRVSCVAVAPFVRPCGVASILCLRASISHFSSHTPHTNTYTRMRTPGQPRAVLCGVRRLSQRGGADGAGRRRHGGHAAVSECLVLVSYRSTRPPPQCRTLYIHPSIRPSIHPSIHSHMHTTTCSASSRILQTTTNQTTPHLKPQRETGRHHPHTPKQTTPHLKPTTQKGVRGGCGAAGLRAGRVGGQARHGAFPTLGARGPRGRHLRTGAGGWCMTRKWGGRGGLHVCSM